MRVYVAEVLRAGTVTIPDTVPDAVLARVARLDDRARALLDVVATVSPSADMWLVEAMAGDLTEKMEDCLSSGMLITDDTGVAFRHELGRLAVYESIPPNRRLELHRRALASLADPLTGSPDAAVLAHHAEAASDRVAVLRYAPEAAVRAASLGAHREAAAQYARALRFGAGLPVRTRAEFLEARAASCYFTDQYADGIAALEEALACRWTLGDRLGEGDALRLLSEFLWCPGRTAEADARARESVALLENEPPGRQLGLAYANLAHLRQAASASAEALDLGGRALELAERLDDEEIAVRALAQIGLADDASGGLELSLKRARGAGLSSNVAETLNLLAAIAVADHRYADAQQYLDEGLTLCAERGIELHRLYLLSTRAHLELDQGHWADAADTAESVKRVPRTSTTPRIHALVVLGLLRARRGDPQVHELLDEARELAWPTGELHRIAPVAAAMAEAAWLRGDRKGLAEAIEPALELALERDAYWIAAPLACWWQRAGFEAVHVAHSPDPWNLELAGRPLDAGRRWAELGCAYEAAVSFAQTDNEDVLRQSHNALLELGALPAAAIVTQTHARDRCRRRATRAAPKHTRQSSPAHHTRARDHPASSRRSPKRRDRGAALPVAQDCRTPRLGDPPKAERRLTRRSGLGRTTDRPAPRRVAQRRAGRGWTRNSRGDS